MSRTTRVIPTVVVCLMVPLTSRNVRAAEVPAELVRNADFIIHCEVGAVKEAEGGKLITPQRPKGDPNYCLKGHRDYALRPIFLGQASRHQLATGDRCVLFLKADPANKRHRLMAHEQARLPAEKGLIAKVGELVKEHPRIAVKMGPKTGSVPVGSLIELVWTITNTSPESVRVHASPYVFLFGYRHAGARRGAMVGTHSRKQDSYRLLKPGESFEYRKTVKTVFPEGEVRFTLYYINDDNWYAAGGRKVLRYDDVVITRRESTTTVTIAPPSREAVGNALGQLASRVWEDQLRGATLLARSKQTAARPELVKMAGHPWSEVRKLVADALTSSGAPAGEPLKSLIYDPVSRVRYEVVSLCAKRRVPDCSLPILALALVCDEAVAEGWLPKGADSSGLYRYLTQLRDPRLGGLLSSRAGQRKCDAMLLAEMVRLGHDFRRRYRGEAQVSEQDLKRLGEAWNRQRSKVDAPWAAADLEREMAACRASAFSDFRMHEKFPEILARMKKMRDSSGGWGRDEDRETLAAMGPAIVPTAIFIMNNHYAHESGALFDLFREWGAKEAVPLLLEIVYGRQRGYATYYAPSPAVALDREAAYPQLGRLYPKSQGAALALAQLGERRAVPYLIRDPGISRRWHAMVMPVLRKVTGQKFVNWYQLNQWWEKDGSKQKWE